MKKLEDTTSLFLSNLLGVSKRGCPTVGLYVEMNSLLTTNQILLNQMKFLHQVATLPTSTLAWETYEEIKNKELLE